MRAFFDSIEDSEAMLIRLQIVAAFMVTGRESEIGFRDDYERYNHYKEVSKANMRRYVKLNDLVGEGQPFADEQELETYIHCLDTHVYTAAESAKRKKRRLSK